MYNKNVGINNFANQKQGGENMSKELFVRAEEVAGVLGISKPYAYKLVRVSEIAFSNEYGSLVISKGIRFSRTACLRNMLRAVVIFIPKSEKRDSACFFNSESVFTLIVAVIYHL
jgi:hypothetical protein